MSGRDNQLMWATAQPDLWMRSGHFPSAALVDQVVPPVYIGGQGTIGARTEEGEQQNPVYGPPRLGPGLAQEWYSATNPGSKDGVDSIFDTQDPIVALFASPWSPPAWMKTSGKLGTGRVRPEFYPAFAKYLLKFVQAYEAEGLPIYAITVQNEPQHQDARYPTTLWTASEQRDFIRDHLGPLFQQQNMKTLIWCWDHNWNQIEFPRTILADPQAARYVDGTGFHHYEGRVEAQSALQQEFPEKHIYFTEGSVFRTRGALRLIDILRHGSRSYNAWVIMLDEHRKPNRGPHSASATCVELFDDESVRYNYDYYMQGQFMKFIQRNAVRVETSLPEISAFSHVAFINPDGQVVLVAVNARRDPQSLAVQCGDRMFEAELPGESVATYLFHAALDGLEETSR